MTDNARLTIAVIVTTLLLLAISIAGFALHTGGQPAPTASAPALTTQTPHAASTPTWSEEHD